MLDGKSKSAFALLLVDPLFHDSQRRIIIRPFSYAGPKMEFMKTPLLDFIPT